jgi:hypothetical protein
MKKDCMECILLAISTVDDAIIPFLRGSGSKSKVQAKTKHLIQQILCNLLKKLYVHEQVSASSESILTLSAKLQVCL